MLTSLSFDNKSIAVLPFKNISNSDENEYFTDGITDEIINALTKVKGLKVTARTSAFVFKNKHVDVRHIGNELKVASVLEGSVRFHSNKVRITVHLIRTDNGYTMWSQNFDRNLHDIFELQDEISLLIAEQIRENFGHLDIADQLSTLGTSNVEAYKLYLKGRFYQLNWNLPDYLKAIDFYKQSIETDPNFTDALYAISRSYGILTSWGFFDKQQGQTLAKSYLEKGAQVNQNSYWYYFSKSSIQFWNQWDYKNGIQTLKKAFDINPNFAVGYEGLAEIYMAASDLKKASINIDKALEINPLSANHHFIKGNIYFLKKDYKTAISYMEATLKIDPNFSLAIETKLASLMLLNDKDQFEAYIARMPQLQQPEICEELFLVMNEGKRSKLTTIDIETSFKSLYPWDYYLMIHSGQTQKALDILEEKAHKKLGQLINFKCDPFLEPLRSSKRYKKIEDEHRLKSDITTPSQSKKLNNQLLDNTQIVYYKHALIQSLEIDKVFLNPNLALKELATIIDLHPNKLSWLINESFKKNYNDFINSYRLDHFKELALLPENKKITLLGLAYDSGFNSKTVFNTYFKKEIGTTPKAWLKSHK